MRFSPINIYCTVKDEGRGISRCMQEKSWVLRHKKWYPRMTEWIQITRVGARFGMHECGGA